MHPLKSLRVALIILSALPAALCFAQEKPADEAARPVRVDPTIISIDFPGGKLSYLVASLGSSKEGKLSIIQPAGLDPLLPAFSVRDVRIDSVMAALGRILEPQGYILNPTGPNIAVLTKLERHGGQAFASFQLENKIGTRSVEEVIAAIQQGCEFASEGRPATFTLRFKYHPGTKLLFVAGTEQEVDVAHRVFGSLPDSPAKPGTPAPEKK